MKTIFPVILFAVLTSCAGHIAKGPSDPMVIPAPESIRTAEGYFELHPQVRLDADAESQDMGYAADAFSEMLVSLFGDRSGAAGTGSSHVIMETDSTLPASGYRLEIAPEAIKIDGGDAAGCFYAVQTLRQLIPAEAYGDRKLKSVRLPAMTVTDAPQMEYRGMMLDVARHFFSAEEVKKVLDIMALHKLNVFHWHLTDDQGWRIEIDAYPELTRIGSVRSRTIIGKDPGGEYDETTRYDDTPHGGFYTKDQIRDIVSYARARFITVIPEVEFPGHAVAALASYPWLGCTGEQYEVRQTWDIDDRVFCIGKESTFTFLENVLSEVIGMFPSAYIHIGGDECPDKMWRKCPDCLHRMQEENLKAFRELQGYGVARIGAFLEARGRHLIGWDEILDAGVTPSSIVMSWRGTEGGEKAARQGNRVIMCPTEYCYFDYYQLPDISREPLAWGGLITLHKAYSFNPFEGLDPQSRSNVLGVQANLWTEYISDISGLEYMMLPRLAALSETAWSLPRKDWRDFCRRMDNMTSLYDALGYEHAHYSQNEE